MSDLEELTSILEPAEGETLADAARRLKAGGTTIEAFQRANVARCNAVFRPLFDSPPSFYAMALAGEVGELCNKLKKLADGMEVPWAEVESEFGDVLPYLALLAERCGVALEAVTVAKFNEVSAKKGYPVRLGGAAGSSGFGVRPLIATEPGRPHHLAWTGVEWADDRCGCRYHPDDDNGSHGGAPHVHRCERHSAAVAAPHGAAPTKLKPSDGGVLVLLVEVQAISDDGKRALVYCSEMGGTGVRVPSEAVRFEPEDAWKAKAAEWLRKSDEAGDAAHTAFVVDSEETEAAWERVDDVLVALADTLDPLRPRDVGLLEPRYMAPEQLQEQAPESGQDRPQDPSEGARAPAAPAAAACPGCASTNVVISGPYEARCFNCGEVWAPAFWCSEAPLETRCQHWRKGERCRREAGHPHPPYPHVGRPGCTLSWADSASDHIGPEPAVAPTLEVAPGNVADLTAPARVDPTAPPPGPVVTIDAAPACPAGGSCSDPVACMRAGGCTREPS